MGGRKAVASRCAISEPDSMERSQLSDIDSGGGGGSRGGEEKQSILEFRGIGRERRCEGHQSGKERERGGGREWAAAGGRGPIRRPVRRKRAEGSDCFKDGSARVEREKERGNKGKRKVAAVSRFDCAMFSDSSRERERERESTDYSGRKRGTEWNGRKITRRRK